jgi:chromosomal replication initiator protein
LIEGDAMATASPRPDKTFERVKAQLKARLGTEVYSSWFACLKLAESSKSIVRLSVPTAFLRSWINGHYVDLIGELWRLEDAEVLKVEIVVRTTTRQGRATPDHEQPAPRKIARPQIVAANGGAQMPRADRPAASQKSGAHESEQRQSVLGSPLDGRYTFESFIEGPSNRVAFAAARAVAEQSANARFNPLFLHATVGLGKTHLLQAIAADALKRFPQARVVYLTAEYFMWRFATAIRDNNARIARRRSWNRSSRACAPASTAASPWKCRRRTIRCASPC